MSTCFLAFASLCFVCELVSRSSLSIFPFYFGNCSFLCAASFPVPNCSKIVQNMTSYLLDRKHNGVKEKCEMDLKGKEDHSTQGIGLHLFSTCTKLLIMLLMWLCCVENRSVLKMDYKKLILDALPSVFLQSCFMPKRTTS